MNFQPKTRLKNPLFDISTQAVTGHKTFNILVFNNLKHNHGLGTPDDIAVEQRRKLK
jgi:hypothetical protein